jgi:hypothetical protein
MTRRAISTWPAPSVLFEVLGAANVQRKAADGDREAQLSLGYRLVSEADAGAGRPLGSGGRSPKADVGFSHGTA